MNICVFLSAADLSERKAVLLERSDALMVMPGGLGTLDEATEILELRKHRRHDKPVVLLNTAGFYDGLVIQLRRMEQDGFLPVPLDELVFVAEEPDAAMEYLERAVN
ncbi:LOG family protein [Mycolicibacterium fortuitum]|nr:LOG family protein [Mycolicibacterium fortuitum]